MMQSHSAGREDGVYKLFALRKPHVCLSIQFDESVGAVIRVLETETLERRQLFFLSRQNNHNAKELSTMKYHIIHNSRNVLFYDIDNESTWNSPVLMMVIAASPVPRFSK